jgi:hypothetical protein
MFRTCARIHQILCTSAYVCSLVTPALAGPVKVPIAQSQLWHIGGAALRDGGGQHRADVTNSFVRLGGIYPLQRSHSRLVAATLRYDGLVNAWQDDLGPVSHHYYHAPLLGVAFQQAFSERWGFTSFAGAGFASDTRALRITDLRYLASVGVTYSASESFEVRMGVVLANSFYVGTPAIPLLELKYCTPQGMTELWLGVPRGAGVWHVITRRADLGVLANVNSLRFGLHSSDRIGDEYRALVATVGPAARLHIGRGIFLQGDAGSVAHRHWLSTTDRVVAESSVVVGWYFSIAFGIWATTPG